MLQASRSLRHPGGRIPLFGDQDSGRVIPAGFDRPPSHDNLLWLGCGVLGLDAPLPGDPHPELAWTLGSAIWLDAATRPHSDDPGARVFLDSGFHVLAGENWHTVVNCHSRRARSRNAHAHNDTLSFELSIGGVPLIVDSGTYSYSGDPAARNRFRAAAAHNVTVLDGEEPVPIDPALLFELAPGLGCRLEHRCESPARSELVAVARDYLRLPSPVMVRRMFVLERDGRGALSIEDELLGAGTHTVTSHLHTAPGTKVRLRGRVAELRLRSARVRISFGGCDGVRLTESEVSDRYGVRERAPLLTAVAEVELPHRLGYRISVQ
jgi:hypothetical protein